MRRSHRDPLFFSLKENRRKMALGTASVQGEHHTVTILIRQQPSGSVLDWQSTNNEHLGAPTESAQHSTHFSYFLINFKKCGSAVVCSNMSIASSMWKALLQHNANATPHTHNICVNVRVGLSLEEATQLVREGACRLMTQGTDCLWPTAVQRSLLRCAQYSFTNK